jgi:hypothetical protein
MELVIIVFFLAIFAGMLLLGFAVFLLKRRRHSKNIRRFGNNDGNYASIHNSNDTDDFQFANAGNFYANSSADYSSEENKTLNYSSNYESEKHQDAQGYVSAVETPNECSEIILHDYSSSSGDSSSSYDSSSSSSDCSSSSDSGSSSSSD